MRPGLRATTARGFASNRARPFGSETRTFVDVLDGTAGGPDRYLCLRFTDDSVKTIDYQVVSLF
jgi:hypothetical protein